MSTPPDKFVRVVVKFNTLKIYFGEVLHFKVRLPDLFGVQSWSTGSGNYSIEFTAKDGGHIVTEYTEKDLWLEILRQLDTTLEENAG